MTSSTHVYFFQIARHVKYRSASIIVVMEICTSHSIYINTDINIDKRDPIIFRTQLPRFHTSNCNYTQCLGLVSMVTMSKTALDNCFTVRIRVRVCQVYWNQTKSIASLAKWAINALVKVFGEIGKDTRSSSNVKMVKKYQVFINCTFALGEHPISLDYKWT